MVISAAHNVPPFITAKLTPSSLSFERQVEQMWSGDKYNFDPFDQFTVVIPFCLDFIKWDVIYNAGCPTVALDVIFGPKDEDFHAFHMSFDDGTQASNYLSD